MQEEFMQKVLGNFEKVFKKLEEHDEKFEKSDAKLNKNMEDISTIFKNLIKREDERYEVLHNSLLVIEDKVSRELPALFDFEKNYIGKLHLRLSERKY